MCRGQRRHAAPLGAVAVATVRGVAPFSNRKPRSRFACPVGGDLGVKLLDVPAERGRFRRRDVRPAASAEPCCLGIFCGSTRAVRGAIHSTLRELVQIADESAGQYLGRNPGTPDRAAELMHENAVLELLQSRPEFDERGAEARMKFACERSPVSKYSGTPRPAAIERSCSCRNGTASPICAGSEEADVRAGGKTVNVPGSSPMRSTPDESSARR